MCSPEPCQNVDVYEIGRHAYSVQHTWESDDHSQSSETFSTLAGRHYYQGFCCLKHQQYIGVRVGCMSVEDSDKRCVVVCRERSF